MKLIFRGYLGFAPQSSEVTVILLALLVLDAVDLDLVINHLVDIRNDRRALKNPNWSLVLYKNNVTITNFNTNHRHR